VADSYLNWIWWFLEPLCFMLIYSYVFGYVFNAREQYFSVYIFIGLSMWNFFSKTVQSSVKIIRSNKAIISRVYFPKYILLLVKIWINGFKMIISFGIVAAMMAFFRIPITWNILFAVPVLLVLVIFTFGCGCLLMNWGVYVNDLSNIINIVTKMLFYVTGVFYNLEKRIPEIGAALNRYNPVAYLLSSMRQCLIYGSTPDLGWLVFWLVISVALALLGVCTIYKEENSYVKAI
jgi:ABC-type polysaccharide/polyol phosphate export permease